MIAAACGSTVHSLSACCEGLSLKTFLKCGCRSAAAGGRLAATCCCACCSKCSGRSRMGTAAAAAPTTAETTAATAAAAKAAGATAATAGSEALLLFKRDSHECSSCCVSRLCLSLALQLPAAANSVGCTYTSKSKKMKGI